MDSRARIGGTFAPGFYSKHCDLICGRSTTRAEWSDCRSNNKTEDTNMRCNLCMSAFGAFVAFSSTALAADLPPRPAYKGPPVVVAYNWTGLYVGAHAGYGWSKFSGTDLSFGDSSTGKAKGPLGGFQIGYNYQMNWLVLG